MEKAHKTDVVGREKPAAGFVYDGSDPDDPKMVDRERDIVFRVYVLREGGQQGRYGRWLHGPSYQWFALHWHGQLIRINARLTDWMRADIAEDARRAAGGDSSKKWALLMSDPGPVKFN